MPTDDVITWSPRVGTDGDDKYDPGEIVIKPGTYSTGHTPPRVSDVHACTAINQIIMECYRRQGSTTGLPTSPTAGSRLSGSWESALRDAIDDIRSADGSGAYSWPDALSVDHRLLRANIIALRKALVTDVLPFKKTLTRASYRVSGASYYPADTYAGAGSYLFGQHGIADDDYDCFRTMFYYNGLPNSTVKEAVLRLTIGDWARQYDRAWNIELYQTYKDETLTASTPWDCTLRQLVGSIAPPASGSVTFDIDLDVSLIDPESDFWLVVSSDLDFAADQPGYGASGDEYAYCYTIAAYLVANGWVGD